METGGPVGGARCEKVGLDVSFWAASGLRMLRPARIRLSVGCGYLFAMQLAES